MTTETAPKTIPTRKLQTVEGYAVLAQAQAKLGHWAVVIVHRPDWTLHPFAVLSVHEYEGHPDSLDVVHQNLNGVATLTQALEQFNVLTYGEAR